MIRSLIARGTSRCTIAERARKKLQSIKLTQNCIGIDCGANVGHVTEMLARNGATVYAFEPNPHAYKTLSARFGCQPNVHCSAAGVGESVGKGKLYFHQRSGEDELHWSTGSSMLACKGNICRQTFHEIEVIDLCAFIHSLDRTVRVLKMDIEGLECRVLSKMVHSGAIDKVEHVFAETHDHKIPELVSETSQLRDLISRRGLSKKINLDWE